MGKFILRVSAVIIFVVLAFGSKGTILVLNGLTHEDQALPGEVTRGTIEIQNIADIPQSVQIYQKDYWYSYTGETRHDDPGTLDRSNASWLNINPTFITLEPNETTTIEYELTVPEIDTLIGTYWSILMVEGITPPDTTNVNMGLKINTVVRYGIQIITNIGDTGERNLEFINFELAKNDTITELVVDIGNIGERILRPELGVEVYDEEGETVGTIKIDPRKIYPGTSAQMKLDLSTLKAGNYTGILIADCGDDYIFGSNLTLEIQNE